MKNCIKYFYAVVIFFAAINISFAAEKKKPDFTLPEVIITASRVNESDFESPKAITLLKQKDMEKETPRMLPEAILEAPAIFLQKTTLGHGTPIIRGFIGRDNLVLEDGIRLNNSTFRSGAIQYMNTINNLMIEKIEIVRGPGSVLYGSDAMGGVVNVITKHLSFSAPVTAKLISNMATADRGTATRIELGGKIGEFNYLIGGAYKNFADLRAGGNFGIESPTGFNEQDADAKVQYNFSENQRLSLSYQYTRQNDVPRYEKYTGSARIFSGTGGYDKFIYNPQIRHLDIVQYEQEKIGSFIENLNLSLSFQRQTEGSEQKKTGQAKTSLYNDSTGTYGTLAEFTSLIGGHKLTYGTEYYYDLVNSQYWDYDSNTGTKTEKPANSTFPDGSKYYTLGIFLQDQWQIIDPLKLVPGIRFSRFEYSSALRNPPLSGSIGEAFSNFTGSIGIVYSVVSELNLIGNVSQGFRAPNLDDLVTLRTTNQGVDVPSYGLKSESSINYEIGIKGEHKMLNWSAFYYFCDISDKIERKPGLFNGLSFIDDNNNGTQDKNELPVWQKFNIGKSQTQGIELDSRVYLDETYSVSVFGNVTWTYGQNMTSNEPLSYIPPIYGSLGIHWEPSNWWVESYTRFAGRQDRLSSRDKSDPRMDPNGTPAWITYNLRSGIALNDNFTFTGGIENILDAGYRMHGSGIDAPGINFHAGIEMRY